MVIHVTPPAGPLDAAVTLPASKSISNRVLVMNALTPEAIPAAGLSRCDDTDAMLRALSPEAGDTIDVGAAGTAMRFLAAYLAVTPGTRTLTGSARMKQRPVGPLVDALRALGADIRYVGNEGFPPLLIRGGRVRGGRVRLAGSVSSQYVSALLLVAPVLDGGLELELTGDIVSRPYIDLTLRLMTAFGARARWTSERQVSVAPVPYRATAFRVEGDWSAASYWYEILALKDEPGGRLSLEGLAAGSPQGDARVAEYFRPLGVETDYAPGGVRLRRTHAPAPARLELDLTGQPDLAQTLAVTAALRGIPFRIGGLRSLRIKETDRMAALVTELRKLGYVLRAEGDEALLWEGGRCDPQPGAVIDTYEDHRMAMAFAPACLRTGRTSIRRPEVVTKSYPGYWADLAKAGFTMTEEEEESARP